MKRYVSLFIILFLAFSGWYIYGLYSQVNQTMDEIYTPIERTEVKAEKIAAPTPIKIDKKNDVKKEKISMIDTIKPLKPISLLILGIDGNGHSGNRSDVLIMMTINPKENKTTMVSIPRDTRTWIVGKEKMDKINHAYAFGGPQMAINTVEHFLAIPVDYFVSINMKGFEDIINLLGGVTIHNEFAFTESGVYFPKGELTLDGRKVLAFARMRKSDPQGDVGRNARQHLIIQAAMEKGAKLSSLPKTNEFLKVVRNNVKTNITLEEIKTLQQYYQTVNKNEVLTFKGQGEKINHIWYYVIPKIERKKVTAHLKTQLH